MRDNMSGSGAFHRLMEFNYGDEERAKLMREVWSVTPWIVHVRTGSVNGDLSCEIINWCRDNYGKEASPVHGRQGAWQRSCVTIYGWTDYGFATEAMMRAFMERYETREDDFTPGRGDDS